MQHPQQSPTKEPRRYTWRPPLRNFADRIEPDKLTPEEKEARAKRLADLLAEKPEETSRNTAS